MLNALPIAEWNGGKIHRVRDHILHLMRGQVFRLDDMTFFTMGGATSHDIEGSVLNPSAPDFRVQYFQAILFGKRFRILDESWWPEELPSDEEYEEALVNLEQVGWQVDCILTHCAPTDIAFQMSRHNEADLLYEKGIPSPREKKRWTQPVISSILSNSKYIDAVIPFDE